MSQSHLTKFGFVFGPVEVTRICSAHGDAYVRVTTARQEIDIRVTPTGIIRLGRIIQRVKK